MIIRIVQMTFRESAVDEFLALFSERKSTISSFKGCTHLELWQDTKQPNVFFTHSHWLTEADLDHYRFSDFFKDTWGRTRVLFSSAPQAWSVVRR